MVPATVVDGGVGVKSGLTFKLRGNVLCGIHICAGWEQFNKDLRSVGRK